MVKFKKFLAIFVASSMMLSLAACGDSSSENDKESKSEQKGDSEDSKSVDSKSVDNIYDALALAGSYTSGTYSVDCSIKGDTDGEAVDMSIGLDGKYNGENATYGLSIKGSYEDTDMSYSFPDVFTLADGVFYIDLDSIINAIGVDDTEFGSFGIPMPDVETSGTEELQTAATDFLKAAFDGVEATQNGTAFTIEAKDAETYQKVATNVMNYINDNQEDIQKFYDNALDSTSDFDVAKYVEKLADYYKDDILSASEVLGYELSEDDYDSYVDEALDEIDSELEDLEDEADEEGIDLFEDWDDVMDEFNDLDWDDFADGFDDGKMETSLTVDASDSAYKLSFAFTFDYDDTTMDVALNYEINVEDVTVEAPSNAASITDIVTYVMNNPDLLEEFSELYSETGLGSSSSSSSIDDYDDLDYWDYDDDSTVSSAIIGEDDTQTTTVENDGDYTLNFDGTKVTFEYDTDVLTIEEEDEDYGVAFYDAVNYAYSVSSYVWAGDSADEMYDFYTGDYYELSDAGTISTQCGDVYVLLDTDANEYYLILGVGDSDSIVSYLYIDDDAAYTIEEIIQALYAGM
jgi:hypothetical protein